jgi:polyisoprenoid-binding protein YceI
MTLMTIGFSQRVILITALMSAALPAYAASSWTVVPGAASRISFSGEHAGNKFKGSFEKWDAVIAFDPADLAGSKATVTVAMASAKTGDPTYDKTLPTADWFDITKGATGVFETTAFRAKGGDDYEADGTLTIRGVKVPVVLAFTFKSTGDTATLTGKTALKRLDFGMGKGSDADGSWVSLAIPLDVSVSLKK